ncbi:hypothetical protein BABINDRAFT_147872 [Babjeviella inositovora NRRL Y-12698]|uniref:Uncharacterized protein n=1 Tax=Babjeviella inositovora NRRL Y-12698 TaxID=984486 RepID=A0A1E3QN26_9ASCO|nr:uncharacterized protein BABINDRAFT_147872 [Babjeviella inositovora NRRL Y-12698]ODQ79083.1 hypothetical protein BABINDRAFT_147872 [Babjeviella inositovora NRRL Y-12698]
MSIINNFLFSNSPAYSIRWGLFEEYQYDLTMAALDNVLNFGLQASSQLYHKVKSWGGLEFNVVSLGATEMGYFPGD